MTEIFQYLSCLNEPQWLFIDGSIIKAHQTAGQAEQAIGRIRGGEFTKIHLAVYSGGC